MEDERWKDIRAGIVQLDTHSTSSTHTLHVHVPLGYLGSLAVTSTHIPHVPLGSSTHTLHVPLGCLRFLAQIHSS